MVEAGKPTGVLDENPLPSVRHTYVVLGALLGYLLLKSKEEEMVAFSITMILPFDPLVSVKG